MDEETKSKFKYEKYVYLGVTIFIWIYWFTKKKDSIEAWKMLFFNVIMVIGIRTTYKQMRQDEIKKND